MVKFHPKKINGAEKSNRTTLGFHGITRGTHTSMVGVQSLGCMVWGCCVVILATTPMKPCSSFFLSFWLFFFLFFFLSYAKDWKTVASLVPIFWTFLPPVSEPQVTHINSHTIENVRICMVAVKHFPLALIILHFSTICCKHIGISVSLVCFRIFGHPRIPELLSITLLVYSGFRPMGLGFLNIPAWSQWCNIHY